MSIMATMVAMQRITTMLAMITAMLALTKIDSDARGAK